MKREDILFYIMTLFVVGIIIKLYFDSESYQLSCISSNVDGKTYCVRERNKIQLVADLLAKVSNKMQSLVDHMYNTYPDRENIKRLKERFNH